MGLTCFSGEKMSVLKERSESARRLGRKKGKAGDKQWHRTTAVSLGVFPQGTNSSRDTVNANIWFCCFCFKISNYMFAVMQKSTKSHTVRILKTKNSELNYFVGQMTE